MFSDKNIDTMLSTHMIMGYSTKTHINNKISQINNISQHTSMIAEYSASVNGYCNYFLTSKTPIDD